MLNTCSLPVINVSTIAKLNVLLQRRREFRIKWQWYSSCESVKCEMRGSAAGNRVRDYGLRTAFVSSRGIQTALDHCSAICSDSRLVFSMLGLSTMASAVCSVPVGKPGFKIWYG